MYLRKFHLVFQLSFAINSFHSWRFVNISKSLRDWVHKILHSIQSTLTTRDWILLITSHYDHHVISYWIQMKLDKNAFVRSNRISIELLVQYHINMWWHNFSTSIATNCHSLHHLWWNVGKMALDPLNGRRHFKTLQLAFIWL